MTTPPPPPGPAGAPAPKRVLVVDDSFIMRRLISEIVESDPDLKVVDTAENGKVALQKARDVKPDLILMDIEMPEMSGIETLRRLRVRSSAKVVILSFRATEGSLDAAEARRFGAADVIEKPSGSLSLDLNQRMGGELVARLRRVLNLPPRAPAGDAEAGAAPAEAFVAAPQQPAALERSHTALLAAMAEGAIEFDPALRVVAVNEAARAILRQPDLAPGRRLYDIFSDYNIETGDLVRSLLATGEEAKGIEAEFAAEDGQWIPLRLAMTPVPAENGGEAGGMLVFEDTSRERTLRQMLERTASRDIASQLLAAGKADLGGSVVRASVLFGDIRGFTALSERLGPQGAVALLNEYFSFMEDVVTGKGGIVDKYIGDAIMALFGIPESAGDDAGNALAAAQTMHTALELFNQRRPPDSRVKIGIGIATGEVIAGNIGSPSRLNYTVIGDAVNMAARIESLTKLYGAGILICEATRGDLGDRLPLRELDRIRVRGQQAPTTLYEVLSGDAPAGWLEAFEAGRAAYTAGAFPVALDHFTAALGHRGDDSAAALLAERCRRLMATPPAGWDGVWQTG